MNSSRDLARRLALIVLTDEAQAGGRSVVEKVRAALRGGAPAVQLRAKAATAREMVELSAALLRETRAAGALLFVNDRLDVALAAGADGAHLGDEDLPMAAARRIVPPDFLLGRSAETVAQARAAAQEGADYLGVGPVYATESKPDAGEPIGLTRLQSIASSVALPVVAIGGIDARNAAAVRGAGAAGIAVIRSVMAAQDAEAQVRELLRAMAESGAG